MSLRSATGCTICNNKQCQELDESRCTHFNSSVLTRPVEASGPVRNFSWNTPMPSSPPDSQSPSSTVATASPQDANGSIGGLPGSYYSFPPNSGGHLDFSLPTDTTWHASLTPPVAPAPFQSSPEPLGNAQAAFIDPLAMHASFDTLAVHPEQSMGQQALDFSPHSSSASGSHPSPVCRTPGTTTCTTQMTPGQASLFQALFSLARPEDEIPSNLNATHSQSSSPPSLHDDVKIEDEDGANENDPEGVAQILCDVPGMDSSVQSNTLAFVLESYAQWFNLTVFDPLRIVDQAKQNIIQQFSRSESDRMRIILVANAFRTLGRDLDLCPTSLSIISALRTALYNNITLFNSNPPSSEREQDMLGASVTLENMLEVILLHFYSAPLTTILGLMQAAAPVFRRACSEPFNQLPNLPNILLEPELHKRYFAVIDVAISVTAARPMFFRYDVTHPPNFFEEKLPSDYGLEWLHGIPDKFIVLFAKINALREDFGANVDPQIVAEIEMQVQETKLHSMSEDPMLKVRRLVVQESWRQAVLIYLYMALCGAHAKDPRVELALKKFIKLIESIEAGRHSDAFMFIAMIVAGVAAHKPADRDRLRRRMLGTRECSVVGIVGNDNVRALDDLWARTDEEGRAAVWDDFRMSNARIVGI